jgi:hypothetical protein
LGILQLGADGIKAIEGFPGVAFGGFGFLEFGGGAGGTGAAGGVGLASGGFHGQVGVGLVQLSLGLAAGLQLAVPLADLVRELALGIEVVDGQEVGEAFGPGALDGL